MHLLLLLVLLLVVRAQAKLGLLGGRLAAAVQAQLARLLGNLLHAELGHVVGDHVGHLAFDVGPSVDNVDLFELTAGRFDVEEPTEGNGDQVNQREEEIHTPTTGGREHGSKHDDGEVANPVGAGRSGSTGGTGPHGVDFGRVDPGQRQQGESEERDEQENTNNGTLGVLGGGFDQASKSNNEGETMAKETNQVQLATTNLFNHKEGRDGEESVDGSEDTTHNQGKTVLKTQVLLEKQGRVVDGSVATGELLEELTRASNHHTLELLGLAEGEERLPAGLRGLGRFDIHLHEVEVVQDLIVVRGQALELAKNLAGLLVVSAHHEPTRGFREQNGTHGHNQREQDLESDGESPLHTLLDVRQTKDDPVGDKGANGNNSTLEAHEETTVVRLGALRLPHGDGGRVHAVSNARHNTTNDELTQTPVSTEGSSRDNSTDGENRRASQDQTRTTNALTKEHGEQRAKEATDFIAGCNSATNNVDVPVDRIRWVVRHGQAAKRLGELSASNQTRHHSLIVTKERETHDSCEGDEHPE